jgi:hypothetical protein
MTWGTVGTSSRKIVRTQDTLLRLLQACGATPAEMDEVERDAGRWGRGSTFINVNETRAATPTDLAAAVTTGQKIREECL